MNCKKMIIKIGMLCALLCVVSLSRQQYRQVLQQSIAKKVIRFHVLANSDSHYDQQVKKQVRDDVGAYVEPLLKRSKDKETSRRILLAHLQDITEVANRSLARQGASYTAYATLAYSDFPQKTYQGFRFPSGRYEALRVVIGQGRGHNWWCVMYPNLCFSEAVKKENVKQWRHFLKSLSQREFEELIRGKKWKVRWKFLEYFMERG